MTIDRVDRWVISCDSCQAEYEWEEDGWGASLYADAVDAEREDVTQNGWTTNGEGIRHCENCPPLELTEAAIAARARALTPNDIPLEGITL
ncbi:hypothetical protein BH09ACT9_BH09ACT9_00250 [soil metagenome]